MVRDEPIVFRTDSCESSRLDFVTVSLVYNPGRISKCVVVTS